MLSVIVPFYQPRQSWPGRPWVDRRAQLATWLMLTPKYLDTQRRDWEIIVCEQAEDPLDQFNRGRSRSVGLSLAQGDQVCFHDCDYVPLEADYTDCHQPTRLILDGIRDKMVDLRAFFGGVVQMQTAQARQAGGYSLEFTHWGYEDTDFRDRLMAQGFGIEHRQGRYRSLDHAAQGFDPQGQPHADTLRMRDIYLAHTVKTQGIQQLEDSWQTMDVEILSEQQLSVTDRSIKLVQYQFHDRGPCTGLTNCDPCSQTPM